jgi:hypothetical protein
MRRNYGNGSGSGSGRDVGNGLGSGGNMYNGSIISYYCKDSIYHSENADDRLRGRGRGVGVGGGNIYGGGSGSGEYGRNNFSMIRGSD